MKSSRFDIAIIIVTAMVLISHLELSNFVTSSPWSVSYVKLFPKNFTNLLS